MNAQTPQEPICGPETASGPVDTGNGLSAPSTADASALRAIQRSGVGPVVEVPRRLRWLEEDYAYPQPARDVNPARWVTDPPIPYERPAKREAAGQSPDLTG
jgi:hypothetical protein